MLSARVLRSYCLINPTIALYFVSIAVIGFAVDDGAIRSVNAGAQRRFSSSIAVVSKKSGSGAALPSPRPLRTVRESFPSHGSSLSLARLRTRLPYGQLAGMHLLVAGRM